MRVVLLALLLSGCANTEVSLLLGPRVAERQTEIAATIQVRRDFAEHGLCAWTHSSEVVAGRPFHPERSEVVTDQVGCGFRWKRD